MENIVPLVVAAQHGDVEAFTRLIQGVSPFAFGLAWQRLQDRQTSQDVVQEALLETYVCLPRLHEPAAFLAWFRRIVIKRIDREQRRHHVITHPVESLEALAHKEEDQARAAPVPCVCRQPWNPCQIRCERLPSYTILAKAPIRASLPP